MQLEKTPGEASGEAPAQHPPLLSFLTISSVQNGILATARVTFALVSLSLGAPTWVTGAIVALLGLAPALFAAHLGRCIDRFGAYPVLGVAIIAPALALAQAAYFYTLWSILLAAPVLGMASSVIHVAVTRILGNVSSPGLRLRNLGYISAFNSLAQFLAPAIAGYLLDLQGGAGVFVLWAVLPICSLVLLLRDAGRSCPPGVYCPGGPKKNALALLADRRLRPIFLINAAFSVALTVFPFVMAMYGAELGLSASASGVVIAMAALGAVAVRLFASSIRGRWSPRVIFISALWATAGLYVLLIFFSDPYILGGISWVLGFCVGIGMPVALVEIYSRCAPDRVSETMGLSMSVAMLPQALVPLALGVVASSLGFAGAIALLACAVAAMAAYAMHYE